MGSGFRTFTAGEVLTASNVQDYLMDQSVMVFADSTARATNIGTANFEEGMVSYLEDSDIVEVYNGTTWASIAPAAVTPMGVLINSTSFSAVSAVNLPLNSFTASYRNYKLLITIDSSSADVEMYYRMRLAGTDASGANYFGSGYQSVYTGSVGQDFSDNGTTAGTLGEVSGQGSFMDITFVNPNQALRTQFFSNCHVCSSVKEIFAGGMHGVTTAYDAISFYPVSGTITGRYQLFGVNE